jgi:putative membrane protein
MVEYEPKSWSKVAVQLRGSVVPRVIGRTLAASLIGVVALYVHRTSGFGIAPILHTLVGAALGLLLVFRTNASYDRWWEGRRLLGMLVNRSRDLARQVASYVPERAPNGVARSENERTTLARWVVLFYRLSAQTLRAERDLAPVMPLVRDDEVRTLEAATHRPNVVYTWISRRLAEHANAGAFSEQRLVAMDANLTSLQDSLGACERIMKTPVPFAYAQHCKLLVTIFCFTVPFAMAKDLGWFTPFGAAVVAFALFGVDEIGVEIEDPFGHDANDLPVEAIGDTIERDTRELVSLPS